LHPSQETQNILTRHHLKHNVVFEVHTAVPTWQKSIDILDFKHKTSLEDGLAKMWEWAKKQPNRQRFVWPEYELEKGIYSFWKNKNNNL
jgi:UDP-glucose 4-epimerase